jgi:hypothetical protein
MGASKFVIVTLATIATVGALGSVASPLSAGQGRATNALNPSTLIDALNDCIQQRFEQVDTRFGVTRVVNPHRAPHRFEPESVAEMSPVHDLRLANLRVVLYVGGVRVMRPTPALPLVGDLHARSVIKGPVIVTEGTFRPDAPEPPSSSALWDESRQAMRAFATRDAHDFTQPGWILTARPVRASKGACVSCHMRNGEIGISGLPKVGDALGVVIYGYRTER